MTWERGFEWYAVVTLIAALLLFLDEHQLQAAIVAATGFLALRTT